MIRWTDRYYNMCPGSMGALKFDVEEFVYLVGFESSSSAGGLDSIRNSNRRFFGLLWKRAAGYFSKIVDSC